MTFRRVAVAFACVWLAGSATADKTLTFALVPKLLDNPGENNKLWEQKYAAVPVVTPL